MQPIYEEYDDEEYDDDDPLEKAPPRRRQHIEEQETTVFRNGRGPVRQPAGPPSDAWSVPGRSNKKKPQQKQRPQERRQPPEYPASRGSREYIEGEFRDGPISSSRQAPPPPPSVDIVRRPEFEQPVYEEVSPIPSWLEMTFSYGKLIISFLVIVSIVFFLFRHIGFYQWFFH